MKNYIIKINGLKTPSGKISFQDLSAYCENILKAAQSALRISCEGYSKRRGSLPKWISDATNLVLTGISHGSACLHLETPLIGEISNNKINKQLSLFGDNIISSDDTALTILKNIFQDIECENLSSDYLDKDMLETIHKIQRDSESIEVFDGDSIQSPKLFECSTQTFEKIEKIRKDSPSPQEVTIVGLLDVIKAKDGWFYLVVDTSPLRGRINPEFMTVEDLRHLWNKRVLVKGTLHYKMSGIAKMIDAKTIVEADQSDGIFEKIPTQQLVADFMRDMPINYERINLRDILGKLETDETEEELFKELKRHG